MSRGRYCGLIGSFSEGEQGGCAAKGTNAARRSPSTWRGAFTLIELLLASAAAAMILIIINSVFVRAIHLRDDATARVRDTRLRARAETAIRDDLQSALVSGGILASTLVGGTSSTSGPGGASFPGYLQMTTSNGHSTSGAVASDVQQVEYYIEKDPSGSTETRGGVLVRAVTRDLLATTPTVDKQETLLSGVESLQVQFYDGANWQDTWEFNSDTASDQAAAVSGTSSGTTLTTGDTMLPEAIRVDVRLAAKTGDAVPPPVEVLVPWTAQPFVGATPAPQLEQQQQQQQQEPPAQKNPSGPKGSKGPGGGPEEPSGPGGGQGPGRPGGPPSGPRPSGGRGPRR